MNVKIDRENCIGCGACVATCPEVFEIDDENKAKLKLKEIPKELEEKTKEASEACPVNVIIIEE
jgi:ferredoxin